MSKSKISDLISYLQKLQAEVGDRPIGVDDGEYGFEFFKPEHVKNRKLAVGEHFGGNNCKVVSDEDIEMSASSLQSMQEYLVNFESNWQTMDARERSYAGASYEEAFTTTRAMVEQMKGHHQALVDAAPIISISTGSW